MTIKEQMLKIVQELPEDATIEEAIDRLYLLYKVGRGIAQADSGQRVSQEDVLERARALRVKIEERTGKVDIVELLDESRGRPEG